ncbi:hypothetical protein AVEN_223912-1 [Araneus ventricosus]|uniref:Uncharacterized protein n=1 Tax=Araneus ventricosus TaxID=182803 RepID=A0A4Y2QYB7_ARAVE|nr:hypothetical protein AVEN_223912-1 [Araneus ventricosus]
MMIEEVEHKVKGKIGDIERRLSELESKPHCSSLNLEFMYSRLTVKPLTFDGLTSFAVLGLSLTSELYKWMDGFCEIQSICGIDSRMSGGGSSRNSRIYVADVTDPCILGLAFFHKFNFTVDLEKNEIRTGGVEIPLFSASVQHSKSFFLLARKKTIIPARSECLIQGVPEVSGQFRYAVTDFPSQASQKGVIVEATLVNLEMEAIPFRVLSLNNKHKILDKGAVIATCEPVVDIVARPQEFSSAQHLPSTLENFEILNEEQRTAVRKLLNEFRNLFSTSDADVDH